MTTIGFLPWWPQNPYQVLLKRELNALGFRIIGNPPLSLWRIPIRRDGLDIVHVHWPHGLYKSNIKLAYAILVLLFYRLFKNNIVWTVHELDAYESVHPRRDEWFRKFVLRLSRHVLVHGEHTERELKQRYRPRCPVSRIRHGSYIGWYADELDRSQARSKLGIPDDAQVFLYFGYIKPYKGVEDLCDAFTKLDSENAVLLIVGKPLNTEIEHRIRTYADVDNRIHTLFGYVPDEVVQRYFRAADVVVFPFRYTQTSGSVMLAMSFGRALIAPKVATLPEYLGEDCTIWFEAGNGEALHAALRNALQADLETMGKASYQRAQALTWQTMAKTHRDVYQEVLSR